MRNVFRNCSERRFSDAKKKLLSSRMAQVQTEASASAIMTTFTMMVAFMNMPTGDRSCASCGGAPALGAAASVLGAAGAVAVGALLGGVVGAGAAVVGAAGAAGVCCAINGADVASAATPTIAARARRRRTEVRNEARMVPLSLLIQRSDARVQRSSGRSRLFPAPVPAHEDGRKTPCVHAPRAAESGEGAAP
ncbi:hypothetical protein TMPK1_25260 [Rhodospirillales bacterium TMPK1]|uniref:Uncharacterized protein n=1 Tax=Roseiterribacter gracilis TaxID=2812848 RepID=A0A8S8XEF7_9PROT|nr:hypothetical protein TMPK1_25260 [Rhodospirillales bacterium TMPK1]